MKLQFLRIIPLVIIFCFASVMHADEVESRRVSHGLGLAAGGTSGFGVAYRGSTEVIGWQTTLGAFGTSRYFDMFAGLELLYYFHKTTGGHRWYALVGSGFVLESFRQLTLVPGVGCGIEFLLWQKLVISVGISLAPYIPVAKPKTVLGYLPLPFPGVTILYNF